LLIQLIFLIINGQILFAPDLNSISIQRMAMEKETFDLKLIRFEIDNRDEQLNETLIEEMMQDFSKFTANLLQKYEIPGERFKLVIGSDPLDKLLNR
jgi:hypothetical protein